MDEAKYTTDQVVEFYQTHIAPAHAARDQAKAMFAMQYNDDELHPNGMVITENDELLWENDNGAQLWHNPRSYGEPMYWAYNPTMKVEIMPPVIGAAQAIAALRGMAHVAHYEGEKQWHHMAAAVIMHLRPQTSAAGRIN